MDRRRAGAGHGNRPAQDRGGYLVCLYCRARGGPSVRKTRHEPGPGFFQKLQISVAVAENARERTSFGSGGTVLRARRGRVPALPSCFTHSDVDSSYTPLIFSGPDPTCADRRKGSDLFKDDGLLGIKPRGAANLLCVREVRGQIVLDVGG